MGGKLNLICGPMYSGKTSELCRRYTRYKLAGKKCLLVKYKKDNRYDNNQISTHDKKLYEAINCLSLKDIDHLISNYDVICIDEIQFYIDAAEYCDRWANNNKIIEVCGLNGTYKRETFEQISLLIPKVDNITFLTAIDEKNGEEAIFTKRIIDSEETELIGGKESYVAVSRINFNINI